jgi:hypothetical protein
MEMILMALAYYSRTCEIVHGAMARLFAAGLLDAHGIQQFDRLCLNDAPQADAASAAAQNPRPDATMAGLLASIAEHGLRGLA